ncbi:hypothetical protein KX935_03895 [Streptobacillus moniliformis]|uniref:hypothetical protein n=1 Tax=Streptobacillus moniliformis TaxID=34105 RepID=UPI0007E31112|nr:hypothetical protein [Streptobacillus moniliformis]QXW66349.1 hypothetical protein KX935_03895 [Streptobacillus moniliformis]
MFNMSKIFKSVIIALITSFLINEYILCDIFSYEASCDTSFIPYELIALIAFLISYNSKLVPEKTSIYRFISIFITFIIFHMLSLGSNLISKILLLIILFILFKIVESIKKL